MPSLVCFSGDLHYFQAAQDLQNGWKPFLKRCHIPWSHERMGYYGEFLLKAFLLFLETLLYECHGEQEQTFKVVKSLKYYLSVPF